MIWLWCIILPRLLGPAAPRVVASRSGTFPSRSRGADASPASEPRSAASSRHGRQACFPVTYSLHPAQEDKHLSCGGSLLPSHAEEFIQAARVPAAVNHPAEPIFPQSPSRLWPCLSSESSETDCRQHHIFALVIFGPVCTLCSLLYVMMELMMTSVVARY